MRRVRAGVMAALVALGWAVLGCGDRSPPAMWPEAPPPTLAVPIGVADPSAPEGGDPAAKPEAAKPEAAKPEAAKPEAAKPAAAKPAAAKPGPRAATAEPRPPGTR